MMKKLEGFVADKLKEYGFGADAVWDCHGTWVVLHKALEQIAAKEGVTFEDPVVLARETDNVAISVTGKMLNSKKTPEKGPDAFSTSQKTEWSIGEASPKNNKNAYPWAMAEKRAKDRVILKLIGLHGHVYSEEEADDFKKSSPFKTDKKPKLVPLPDGFKKTELGGELKDFLNGLAKCPTQVQIDGLKETYAGPLEACEAAANNEEMEGHTFFHQYWHGYDDKPGIAGQIDNKEKEVS